MGANNDAVEIVAAVIVLLTLVVMTTGRAPAVLALICALLAAGAVGIATPAELFAGLSNGGVITIAAMLVIAKGVLHTGVVSRVTFRLLAGVSTAGQALRRLIPPVGLASALINTTPIVAMLIPASKQLEQTRDIPAREVMLPIAHLTTLIAAHGGDILDFSQTLVGGYFTMLLIVDIGDLTTTFAELKQALHDAASARGVQAILMHEDIVSSMHRV